MTGVRGPASALVGGTSLGPPPPSGAPAAGAPGAAGPPAAVYSATVCPTWRPNISAVSRPSTTSPGPVHQRPALIGTSSIEASGWGRPDMARPSTAPPPGRPSAAVVTGHGPALAVTASAVRVESSAASLIEASKSMTRCAPFARANACSKGAWDATRMFRARVAAPLARNSTTARTADWSRRRPRSALAFVATAPIRPPGGSWAGRRRSRRRRGARSGGRDAGRAARRA